MHKRTTHSKCHSFFKNFSIAMRNVPRADVPGNRCTNRDKAADNFQVKKPKNIWIVV